MVIWFIRRKDKAIGKSVKFLLWQCLYTLVMLILDLIGIKAKFVALALAV